MGGLLLMTRKKLFTTPLQLQGEHLRALRENYPGGKLTQEAMAERLGVDRKTYGIWERGQAKPDTSNLEKLADFFNVSTDYILGRSNEMQLGDKEISEATGLKEESIRVLRYLSHAQERPNVSSDVPQYNRLTINFINRVLSPLAIYAVNDIDGDVRQLDTFFTYLEKYVHSSGVRAGAAFEEKSERVTFGEILTLYPSDTTREIPPYGASAGELYREAIIHTIRSYLDRQLEKVRSSG